MQTEKLAKENFLNILQKSLTLTQALEESSLDIQVKNSQNKKM